MPSAAGYLLILNENRRATFQECLDEDMYFPQKPSFAEPVPEFHHSRNVPLVCFLSLEDGKITHLGDASRGARAGSGLSRLNVRAITELTDPVPFDEILSEVELRVRSTISKRVTNGGVLPPAAFQSFAEALSNLSPEAHDALRLFSSKRKERNTGLPGGVRDRLLEQKEAIATAMTIAEIDRKENLRGWNIDTNRLPESFLDGLQSVRLREDPMVIHDLNTVPGFEFVRRAPHNSVVFQNADTVLTVVMANRQPLETTTGTDLIYFNETFACFVMVQYKAMEKENDGAIFRLPDQDLPKEIERMEAFHAELCKCDPDTTLDGFRFNDSPFFIKLCPRTQFDPDNISLIKGMYFPLSYWKRLEQDPVIVGSKGGRGVTFKNSRRHFDNTGFISLVKSGWIGTTRIQSSKIERLIRESLERGRAVTFAVKSDKETAPDGDASDDG
jgi:hypothetical protein